MVTRSSAEVEFKVMAHWDLWAIMDKDCCWWSRNQVGRDSEVILQQKFNNQYCSQSNTTWPNKACRSKSTLHQGKIQ